MNITFNITEYCNFHCDYCYIPDTGRKIFLDKNFFKNIIGTATTRESIITLSGGEPLLHPDIAELLDSCKHLTVRIFTNGTLIGKNLKILLSVRPLIHVSFHKFDTLVRNNVRILRKADINVIAHIVLTEINAGRLDEIIEFFADIPTFILLFPTQATGNNVSLTRESVWRQRIAQAKQFFSGTQKTVYYEVAYGHKDLKTGNYCSGEYTSFVSVDGKIFCCCFMPALDNQERKEIAPMNYFSDCPLRKKDNMHSAGFLCPLYVEPL